MSANHQFEKYERVKLVKGTCWRGRVGYIREVRGDTCDLFCAEEEVWCIGLFFWQIEPC